MRCMILFLACCLTTMVVDFVSAQSTHALPRSAPEAQGVSSAAIIDFLQAANENIDSLHSFMLVRHGKVVAEGWWAPYDASTRHQLYSLSKSFTSTAVGLAIEEGKLNLDDEVTKFFPDEIPSAPSGNLKAMRVRDLLTMSTGHDAEPKFDLETPWTKTFLSQPVVFKPGTRFLYNTPATYMCSAIVQKQTGQTVLDYLGSRLFEPLGIEQPTWGTSPQGISLGGYGLNIRTEDIAKFGQLCLQRGTWNGQQLIPANWIDMATSKQVSNGNNPGSDWNQGYGFQFWRSRHDGYRGDGAFGQYCIVMPHQDAVIAITSGVKNMPAVLDQVWNKLLPGLKDQPLAADPAGNTMLQSKLSSLELPMIASHSIAGSPKELTKKIFKLEDNDQSIEAVAVRIDESGKSRLMLTVAETEHEILIGAKGWQRGDKLWGAKEVATTIATTSAWTGQDELTLKVCYVETPFVQTLLFRFAADLVRLDIESNVSFGPTKKPTITGK